MVLVCHRYLFECISGMVSVRPTIFVSIVLFFSSVLCFCNIYAKFGDDFRSGYSNLNSISMKEHKIFLNFTGLNSPPYMLALIGESVDGGSMMRPEHFMRMWDEVERGLSAELNFSYALNAHKKHVRTLRDCVIFSAETKFALIQSALTSSDDGIILAYPMAKMYNQTISMRRVMFGVQNNSVSMLTYYMAFLSDDDLIDSIKEAELLWNSRIKAQQDDIVKLRLFGDSIVDQEVRQGAFGSIPYFCAGSLFMIILVFITVQHYEQKYYYTLYLTFWTMFCPLLAGLSATGVFALLGIPINCVMLITPFLVLGVGVDDGFLMMQHWFHSSEVEAVDRLKDVLVQTGPSVSLTSFTNIAAFLIGSLLSSSDLRSFCFCTALAMALDWFFQLFIFTPVLLFCQSYTCSLIATDTKKHTSPFLTYCKQLRRPIIRAALLTVLVIYWSISIYFGLQMQEDFSPEKAFDSQSFLARSLLQNEKMYQDHEMIRIFVHQLPKDRADLLEGMKKIHYIEYLCDNFTTWIEDYEEQKLGNDRNDLRDYFGRIVEFIAINPDILKDVRLEYNDDGTFEVKKLAFDICVHGFGSWRERALMLRDLRKKIPSGYSVYIRDSAVFDLILSARKAIIKSVAVTIICMIFLCILFIPSVRATFSAIISVVSITVGVTGGLYLWGADLDVMVLVNLVMAVGLTVDFSAHISYRCFSDHCGLTDAERLANAIDSVAYPTAQAALTTVACVAPLYFYSVYMYVTFAKTILLIATIGLLHTVFVVPLLTSLF